MTGREDVARIGWFSRLEPEARAALIAGGRLQRRAAGTWVHGEGDEDTGLVAVLQGSVYLHAQAPGGREALIGLLPAGRVIGQSRLFGGGPRLVTAVCATDCVVFLVPDGVLRTEAKRRPDLWRSLSALVYGQLRVSIEAQAEILALSPRQRLAARLLDLAAMQNPVRCPQSVLAELIGVSRKAVNGWLGEMEAAGRIQRGYGWIKITDRQRLVRDLD